VYDGKRLSAVPVQIGLADDRWSELVNGQVQTGQALVTGMALQRMRSTL
jgi:hypothetical protein